jgi:hypothetical protein
MKALAPHFAALLVATLLAFSIWSKGDKPADSDAKKVEVWGGTAERVERIRFESPKRTVSLEAKSDSVGRYYLATVDKEEVKPRSPHGAPPDADAGAAEEPPKRTSTRFVGVKEANELAAKLAPLTALREIGPLGSGRAEEFGFDKPEGTLKVKVGGTEQVLVIGGATPGGQERYAKREPGGTVYAVSGDLVQSLLGAESRLLERDFHGFEDADVTRLRIGRSGKSREVVSMSEKKGAWADAAQPSKLDETVGNWLAKVKRLSVAEYVEKPPAALTPESAVVRIEYFGGMKTLGYLELYKLPAEKGSDFYVKTENSRWFVKVLASAGEQVEQDLPSVVK